jgi:hypothetical protein
MHGIGNKTQQLHATMKNRSISFNKISPFKKFHSDKEETGISQN